MGTGYCICSTAALFFLALLIIALNHLSRKEYTEEIERLRRDLQASRDKTGIYLANENYTEMILRLEHQEQEIITKLGNIKALNEEMEKKESLCQQLNISLEQCTEELHLKTEALEQTRVTLDRTEVKLKVTEQERDEKHYLVEKHLETESLLGQQARALLTVADESSTDTVKLHDKLARKRSVESSNSQISRDFRIAFQQKLVHMEESTGQITQEQLKFWTELQSKLALHLEKGSSGLSQVSDQMSTLVNNLNQLIQDLQKQSSDHAHSSHQWIQSHLSTARTRSDAEENNLHTFQSELIVIMQGLARQAQNAQTELQEHKRHLMHELPHLLEIILTHESKQIQRLARLRETFDQLSQQHTLYLEHSQEEVATFQQAKEAHTNHLIKSVTDMFNNILQNIKSESISSNQTLAKFHSDYAQTITNSKNLAQTVTDGINTEIKETTEFRASYEAQSSELCTNVANVLERTSSALVDVKRYHNDLERGVNAALLSSGRALKEEYNWVEEDLRERSERINEQLRTHQDSIQGLLGVVRSSADMHETALEEQRSELNSFVRGGQSDLESHCSYFNDWSHQTTVELRQRDQDVDKFLSEDLHRDSSTGNTPVRKDFHYPKHLAATSPHEHILARYRANLAQVLAEEPSDTSSNADVLLSFDDVSPTSDNSDNHDFEEVTLKPKSASTSNLLGLEKVDLDTSFVSEPGSIQKENKENSNNLFLRPATKKDHRSTGMPKKRTGNSNPKAPSRKILTAQNQH